MPFILHRGNISDKLQTYYQECFSFVKTSDGHINFDAVYKCLQDMETYWFFYVRTIQMMNSMQK